MSRNPDIPMEHGNICAVGSEHSDGDSGKPCGTWAVAVTSATAWPQQGGSGGHIPVLLQPFAAITSRQGQGQKVNWGDFVCARGLPCYCGCHCIFRAWICYFAWRLCSLSASLFRWSTVMLRISWCPLAQQRHNLQLHIPWVMRETCSTVQKYMSFLIFSGLKKSKFIYIDLRLF